MKRLYSIVHKCAILLLFIVLFIYALSEARLLLYPLVLAVLFSYLLFPIANWVEKKGLHRIAANLISIFIAVAVIGSVVYIIYSQVSLLMEELPELKKQAKTNINTISESISSSVGVSTVEFKQWVNEQLSGAFENSNMLADTIFPSTTSTIMAIGLMPVYIFLLLYYRDKLYNFFMMIWPNEKHAKASAVLQEISFVTKRYMGGVFIVVLILCFLNSIGLMIIGLRFAVLLGIISAICNFIPYFGTLLGALFPLVMALFTGDSPSQSVSVIILFMIIQFTENNILTPNITGGSVQVNPLVTILSLIAAGMVWGVPGMFVIIPLMGMFKIILENDPTTKALAFLIGTKGTEKHSVTAKKLKNFFKIGKKNNYGSYES